jgi:hypothetical protein
VRTWAKLQPRHASCTLISQSERGTPAVDMSGVSQQFRLEYLHVLALDSARGMLLESQVGGC